MCACSPPSSHRRNEQRARPQRRRRGTAKEREISSDFAAETRFRFQHISRSALFYLQRALRRSLAPFARARNGPYAARRGAMETKTEGQGKKRRSNDPTLSGDAPNRIATRRGSFDADEDGASHHGNGVGEGRSRRALAQTRRRHSGPRRELHNTREQEKTESVNFSLRARWGSPPPIDDGAPHKSMAATATTVAHAAVPAGRAAPTGPINLAAHGPGGGSIAAVHVQSIT